MTLLKEIQDILEGKGHYGTVEITSKEVGPEVVWVGENGLTASVGMWMRLVRRLIGDGWIPIQGFRWFCVNDIDDTSQRQWYYGIRFKKHFENESEDTIRTYVCGGCTNYSGEGGRGKQIADAFIEKTMGPRVSTRNLDYLLSMIVQ